MPERIDCISGGLKIVQNTERFCFGTDAVCLAKFAQVRQREHVLDMCAGNGAVALLLAAKGVRESVVCLERDAYAVQLAQKSAALNGLEEQMRVVCGDLKNWASLLGHGVFDVVTCNPPYLVPGTGRLNQTDTLSGARHEIHCTIEDVAQASTGCLKFGGRLYMVHRSERLTDVLCALRGAKLEPKRLQFICHRAGTAPDLFLVEARKGGKKGLKVLEPLAVTELERF